MKKGFLMHTESRPASLRFAYLLRVKFSKSWIHLSFKVRLVTCCLIYLACVSGIQSANAQWSSDPNVNLYISGNNAGRRPKVVSDGAGGSIITWCNSSMGFAQRLNAAGVPQWTAGGIRIATSGVQIDPAITTDGANGAIIAWIDLAGGNDIYAQRINASGVLQWAAGGVAICATTGSQTAPTLISDGANGAIITWDDSRDDIYAQRVNGAGTVQWAANGAAICTAANSQRAPTLTNDAAGGAILSWNDARSGTANVFAQRIDASGTVQWTADGIMISSIVSAKNSPALVADGLGGAIIAWTDSRNGNDIYAQRINQNGVAQWAPTDIAVCTAPASQGGAMIASDQANGAVISWSDLRNGNSDIYAGRVNASGVSLWTANGVAISTDPNEQIIPAMAGDGAAGAIITWMDYRNNNYDIYAQRVGASGTVQWAVNGAAICSWAAANQGYPAIVNDGQQGAFIAWEMAVVAGIFAQNINADGTLGIQVPKPIISSFLPLSGYTGTSLTITGNNFTGATAVSIDGNNVVSFTVDNATTITATVNTATVGVISVASADGTGTSTTNFTYKGYISTANGNWTNGSTWLGGNAPPPGAPVTIDNDVILNSPFTNTGTFTVNNSNTLSISSPYTNNGTLHIDGTLEINTGGSFSGNSPVYTAATSSLNYKTSGTVSVGAEWTGNATTAGVGVPANVQIVTGTVNMPLTSRGIAGSLIFAQGTLTMNTAGNLYLTGNYDKQLAGVFNSNGRSIVFNGSANQGIITDGSMAQFDNLIVDKSAGTLTSATGLAVGQTLTLSNGTITVPDITKSVRVNGNIIRTNGYVIGNISRNINLGSNTYVFPVGTISGYTPASFSFAGVSAAGDFMVRGVDGKSANYPISLSTSKYLNRFWSAVTAISFSSANATFDFLPQDIVGGALPGNLKAFKYSGSFSFPAPTDFSINGTSYNFNNITSFSEFGAGEIQSTLPVTLLSFNASLLQANKSQLIWTTSSEVNFSRFILEKSKEGTQYSSVGTLMARGDNSSYLMEDILTDGMTYYRLKIIDIDGRIGYSRVVRLSKNLLGMQLTLFPNPVQNNVTLGHPKAEQIASIVVTGMRGTRMIVQNVVKGAVQSTIDLDRLPAGSYVLIYYNNDLSKSIKFIKQ